MRWKFRAQTITSIWKVVSPFIVATACILTFGYLRGSITPSIIFPMIVVLPHIQQSVGLLSFVLLDYFGARLSSSRIDQFLKAPERDTILGPSTDGSVEFRKASVAWLADDIKALTSSSSPRDFSLQISVLNFRKGI